MPDNLNPDQRRFAMSQVKSRDTSVEKMVRSLLHRRGYRFRLHRKDLPGSPDIVLPKYRTVIFIHGCFWHQHPGCKKATIPVDNADYWSVKLTHNAERDRQVQDSLISLGWRVIVLWGCEIGKRKALTLMTKLDDLLKGRTEAVSGATAIPKGEVDDHCCAEGE